MDVVYRVREFRVDSVRRLIFGPDGRPIAIKPRVFDTLLYLIEHRGELLEKQTLLSEVWPHAIVEENNLSQAISTLRRIFGEARGDNSFIVTEPGRGYRFVAPVEILHQHEQGPSEEMETGARGWLPDRSFEFAAAITLSLAITAFMIESFVFDSTREKRPAEDVAAQAGPGPFGDNSIAVLPFTDLSPEGDQEAFAEGLSAQLREMLDRIPELHVTGHTSSFSFKGTDAPITEIAELLGVTYILAGSVRMIGEDLQIGTQLIEGRTDTLVWSDSHDGQIGDIFDFQQEIATEIAARLQIASTDPIPATDETTPEVYSLYLRGSHINASKHESLPLARELLEQAVELDPNFFPARHQLAWTYRYQALAGNEEADRLARATMLEAAFIWPDRPEVDSWFGWMALEDGDMQTAARYLERGLSRDPDLSTIGTTVAFLRALGRYDQAIRAAEYWVSRDPICAICHYNLVVASYFARRYDDAIRASVNARALGLEIDGLMGEGLTAYAFSLLYSGEPEAALVEFRAMADYPVPRLIGTAIALHALGREDEFADVVRELESLVGPGRRVISRAAVYLHTGDLDTAFQILSGAVPNYLGVFDDPMLEPIKEHPRWPELAEAAGLWPEDPRRRIDFQPILRF